MNDKVLIDNLSKYKKSDQYLSSQTIKQLKIEDNLLIEEVTLHVKKLCSKDEINLFKK